MRPIAPSLHHLHRIRISNVYLLDDGPGNRWLIDCGHFVERPTLLRELRAAGIGPGDLRGVLLTHRHSDHAGNAAFLQRRFGAAIHAHRADAAILDGTAPRQALRRGRGSRIAGLLAAIENRLPARVYVDRALEDGDTVAGLEVHWVPGHTEGSLFFRHPPTGSLFSGDMLLAARPPLTLRQGLAPPYSTYTVDLAQAFESLRAFHARAVPYENLLSGHGRPLLGGARGKVIELLRRETR